MNGTSIRPTASQASAFSVAGWISLLAPPVIAGLTVGLVVFSGQSSVFSRRFGGDWTGVAVLVDAVCFGLGVFSLFGIRKH